MRVFMLLDRSGSMASLMQEAIGSINGYVGKLVGDTKVVLAAFDNIDYTVIRNTTVKGWKDITAEEVSPRGSTPLYDSAARILHHAIDENDEKTYIVIMTDGEENMSRHFNQIAVKALLAEVEEKNWEVIFLGANFDKVAHQASAMGLGLEKTINFAKGNMAAEFNNLASYTTAYATAGTRSVFTDSDRVRAAKKN
jgi:hypothetical protein